MGRKLSVLGLSIVLVFAGGAGASAHAFSPRARAEIVRRALTLMPTGLARQLRKHSRALFAGSLEGLVTRSPTGFDALEPGDGDRRLELRVQSAVAKIDARRPMSEVARSFGEIALVTCDLSFALNVGPSDPREKSFYADYTHFVEAKLSRMSVTFAGYTDPKLARGEVGAFAREIAQLARRDYQGVTNSYFPPGRSRLPQDFDERSIAFAAASLEVSLAVTATARAWLYAWREAHGDLTGAALVPDAALENPFADRDAPDRRARAEAPARRAR